MLAALIAAAAIPLAGAERYFSSGDYLVGAVAELHGDLVTQTDSYRHLLNSGEVSQEQLLSAFSSFVLSGMADEAATEIYPALERKNRSPQVRLVTALVRYKRGDDFAELLEVPKRGILPVFLPLVRRQLGLRDGGVIIPEDFQLQLVEQALAAERRADHRAAANLWLKAATKPGARNALFRLHRHADAARRGGESPRLREATAAYHPDSLEMKIVERIKAAAAPPPSGRRQLAVLLDELADYAMTRGDSYTAAVYARLSLMFDEDNQHAAVILASALHGMGLRNWGAAEFYKRQLTRDGVWNDVLQLSYARVLGEQGRRDESEVALRNYLRRNPGSPSAMLELADIMRADGDFAEAVKLYSGAIAASRTPLWDAYHLRGISHEQLGNWDDAEGDFFRALQIMPDNPYVINYLAYSWLERGENLERALKMLERAQRMANDDPHIADSYGWALHKNNKSAEAAPFLEKALNKMPTDPTVNEHLGDVMLALGKNRQASFYWRRAERFAEKADDKQRLAEKLGSL